jgi:hypothetical protein
VSSGSLQSSVSVTALLVKTYKHFDGISLEYSDKLIFMLHFNAVTLFTKKKSHFDMLFYFYNNSEFSTS